MACSLPLVAPRSFILRLKIHCSKCEGKMKRFLLRTPGILSARPNAREGTVEISATVEPSRIMTLLETGLGLKAELLWEQTPSPMVGLQDLQIVADQSNSKLADERFDDPNMVAQLKQLSGIQGLKSVEVYHSKTIKLTFQGPTDDRSSNDKDVEVVIQDEFRNPKIYHTGAGGGLCGASTACCGGRHHVPNQNMKNEIVNCGCCGNHLVPGYPITSNACAMHNFIDHGNMQWPPQACGCVPPPGPPPPWSVGSRPSAPPIETATYYYGSPPPPPSPPPPARDDSFFYQFSDENTSTGCNII